MLSTSRTRLVSTSQSDRVWRPGGVGSELKRRRGRVPFLKLSEASKTYDEITRYSSRVPEQRSHSIAVRERGSEERALIR